MIKSDTVPFRIDSIDALRGFAVVSIILLHNIEHFDFYFFPEELPEWLKHIDKGIWNTFFFLFGGKSYAIFSLLFGFSFYIQFSNQEKIGVDFRLRFLWRLLILFFFGFINALFYEGDILSFFAVFGLPLLIVCRWSNRAVLITAIILMLQPLTWLQFILALNHPQLPVPENASHAHFMKLSSYLGGDSFIELVKGNLLNGRIGVTHWTWENGRFFLSTALFMFGMLAGRTELFIASEKSNLFWKKALIISSILFIPLFYTSKSLSDWVLQKNLLPPLNLFCSSLSNTAFMVILVSSFLLLYQKNKVQKGLQFLIPIGKMSLSNYIIQSMLGSFIYYGYGMALYQYTGATYSLCIGITMISIQILFSYWWMKHHNQGPLEYLWHRATWL